MREFPYRAIAVAVLLSGVTGGHAVGSDAPAQPPEAAPTAVTDNLRLGRLFFSPATRSALEKLRTQPVPAVTMPGVDQAGEPVADVALQGLVNGSNGGVRAVWINDQPQNANDPMQDARPYALFEAVKQPSVPILLPSRDRIVELKVGERLDVMTGQVSNIPLSDGSAGDRISEAEDGSSLKEPVTAEEVP